MFTSFTEFVRFNGGADGLVILSVELLMLECFLLKEKDLRDFVCLLLLSVVGEKLLVDAQLNLFKNEGINSAKERAKSEIFFRSFEKF